MHIESCARVVLVALAVSSGFPTTTAAEWLQHRKLFGADTNDGDNLGRSVALDGDRLAVGASDRGPSFTGAVYLFERNVGGPERWGQVGQLTPSDGPGYLLFGARVDLDGDTLAATAPGAELAYVFERQADESWLEVARLESPDPESDFFASSVAIEGDTVFVGAELDDEAGSNSGAVWLFQRDAGGPGQWESSGKIISAQSTPQARFGRAAAVDGGILVVGASQDSERALQAGAAHVFERDSGGVWIEVAKLLASDPDTLDWFAESVAVSGTTVVAGSENAGDGDDGAAYVFERDGGGAWTLSASLTPSDLDTYGAFGASVAIWSDLITVGDWGDDSSSGAAHLFRRDGEGWLEVVKLAPAELDELDNFGASVAAGPRTVVVGTVFDDDRGSEAGAAYLFLERDLALAFAGTCPGEVTLTLTGATARAPIAVLWARRVRASSQSARAQERSSTSRHRGCCVWLSRTSP